MIKRFPTIPNAVSSGELTRRIWQSPKFFVQKPDNATAFVHQLPFRIPEKIRRRQVASFTMLFSSQAVDIKKEIEEAYGRAKYRGTPVARLIDGALRAVLTEAMAEIFIKAKKSDDPYAKYMEGGRDSFATAARPRRVPNRDLREKRAIRLARLYHKVLPTAAEILKFVKQYDHHKNDHDRFRTDLENKFPIPWITYITRGKALQHLPEIPGHEASQTLSNLYCTRRQLAVGIVWAIEDERGEQPSLNATTILEEYIPSGRKLLGKSRSPKRL